MKTEISKSVKRAMSLALAFIMLVGTLFTANVGITISADATTEKKVVYVEGGNINQTAPTKGTGTEADPFIIENAHHLRYIAQKSTPDTTYGKYYKVDPTIDILVFQTESYINSVAGSLDAFLALDAEETKTALSTSSGRIQYQSGSSGSSSSSYDSFAGNIDFSGVTICGMYNKNGGLIAIANGGVTLKNLTLCNNLIESGWYNGNLVGYVHNGSATTSEYRSLTISNIEINDCYQTTTGNGWANTGVLLGTGVNSSKIPFYISNVITHDNISLGYKSSSDTTMVDCALFGALPSSWSGANDGVQNASYSNIVTLDCVPYPTQSINNQCTRATFYFGVYTTNVIDATPNTWDTTWSAFDITVLSSADLALGLGAATNMKKLMWASSETEITDGDSYWFARENDYPTPIQPDDDYWRNLVIVKTWSGSAASSYAGGTGTKEDPYIIKTAEQLYRALSTITDSTNNVAGGYQSSQILKQGSTTEYVPVYTPYYYKVDGVSALYLNDIVGNESLSGIKALVSGGDAINWAPGKSFVGELDGNGVTIYGMYCSSGTGLVNKLDGTAVIKNINFDSCYATSSGNTALVTTQLGSYTNDSTHHTIANISVRNSYLKSTRDLVFRQNTSNSLYEYNPGPAAIVSSANTCENLNLFNCIYDGYSCERVTSSSTGEITEPMIGAIISGGNGMNNTTVSGCVALGAPVVDEVYCAGKEVFYNRYDANQGFQVYFYQNYTDKTQQITTAYPDKYDKLESFIRVSTKDVYTLNDFPLLQWGRYWELTTFDTRTIPMPLGNFVGGGEAIIYNNVISLVHDGFGATANSGVTGNSGKYGWEHKLAGSGTEEDPFLITTALELAQAIGSGGKHYHNPYYYKLTCDIDLTGSTWINQQSVESLYVYVPFEGVLDGAGHTVTGVTCVDETAAGFIPVLNGGTVKNLRLVDCYAGSSVVAGVIAGQINGGTITNCSVENSTAVAPTTASFVGNWGVANVTNSALISEGADPVYVLDTANTTVDASAITDIYSKTNTDAAWYKGTDGILRLTNFVKGRTVTDVNGDGIISENYEPTDIVALRKCLLNYPDFANIYADISGNGVVNLADLAIMRRTVVDDYNAITDGFWRNVEIGAVEIYYDENDNYDFARKAQLYLEGLYRGVSIKKYTAGTVVAGTEAGTPSGQAYIYIKTDTSLSYDQYKIDFDSANLIVTISGGSFTAVEEAVNEFMQNCDNTKANAGVYTTATKSIDTTVKGKKWIDIDLDGMEDANEFVYYAWGDEFEDEKQTGSIDTAIWEVRNYKYEGSAMADGTSAADTTSSQRYHNLESPVIDAIDDLWEVKDGTLTIWRGVDADNYSDSYAWGYKSVDLPDGEKSDFGRPIDTEDVYVDPGLIQTAKAMLFKQGYSEMRASLPSDGHSFPAWWFYNGVQEGNHRTVAHRTLFGKVYSLNNGDVNPITGKVNNPNEATRWDGTTLSMNKADLTTHKYQLPQAYLEFDIVEFMQAGTGTQYVQSTNTKRTGLTTGDWRDYIQLTIHKYYDQHIQDGKLYIPDWSTGDFLATKNSSGVAWKGMDQSTFVNTAGTSAFIHRFNPDTTTSKYPYTVTTGSWFWQDETSTSASYSVAEAIDNGALSSGKTVTDTYNYGFYWTVNGSAYDLIIYVDFNDDGNMSGSEMVFHIDETVGHEYDDPTWGNTSASKGSDAHVWNQYAYMLLDNAYYTSNPYGTATRANTLSSWGSETGVTPYTDLLTQQTGHGTGGAKDKTTFDIEYVRVYQEDGKRDLVFPETENFNTNNHFGY